MIFQMMRMDGAACSAQVEDRGVCLGLPPSDVGDYVVHVDMASDSTWV